MLFQISPSVDCIVPGSTSFPSLIIYLNSKMWKLNSMTLKIIQSSELVKFWEPSKKTNRRTFQKNQKASYLQTCTILVPQMNPLVSSLALQQISACSLPSSLPISPVDTTELPLLTLSTFITISQPSPAHNSSRQPLVNTPAA